jgi:hypothetical protein
VAETIDPPPRDSEVPGRFALDADKLLIWLDSGRPYGELEVGDWRTLLPISDGCPPRKRRISHSANCLPKLVTRWLTMHANH